MRKLSSQRLCASKTVMKLMRMVKRMTVMKGMRILRKRKKRKRRMMMILAAMLMHRSHFLSRAMMRSSTELIICLM
jgi:hypothetical protein